MPETRSKQMGLVRIRQERIQFLPHVRAGRALLGNRDLRSR